MTSIARLGLAICASLSLGWAAVAALPDELHVTTDIVGYPTHANFNIDRYYSMYAVAIGIPIAALAIYLALTRVSTGRFGAWRRALPACGHVEESPAVVGWRVPAVAAGRTLFIGAVLGLELAIALDVRQDSAFAFMAAYGTVVALVAVFLAPLRDPFEVARMLNVLAAPLAVGGMYLVSRETRVIVQQTGEVFAHPWLPAWFALAAVVVLYSVAFMLVLRPRAGLGRLALERAVVVLVVAPVGLFLLLSTIPGSLAEINYFEEGQILGGADLTRNGAFPWRDLLLAHGLLHDAFAALFGFQVIEDSRWGFWAGQNLVLGPLAWVALYYLCAFLFAGNWLVLAGSQALVVTGHLYAVQVRFILLPFVLLLLAAVLRKASLGRAVAFTALLATQVILTPEALPLAVTSCGAVFAFDAYHYVRRTRLVVAFRRTWLVAIAAVCIIAIWSLFLGSHGALDDWVFSYRAFVPGHRYTGGMPVDDHLLRTFELWAPLGGLLGAFVLAAILSYRGRSFALSDWVMLAAAGLTLLYYPKFLSRADKGHLDHVVAVATPLMLYVGYRYVALLEAWLAGAVGSRWSRWPTRHTVSLPLLVVLLWTAPVSPLDVISPESSRYAAIVERAPEIERVGYDLDSANNEEMITEVAQTLEGMLSPGESVFDFSNTPALFHYLHGLDSETRYFLVSLAIRQRTQRDLVEQLRRTRPGVVVFFGGQAGFSAWDEISNQVRHYDVSQYVLDNYVPVAVSHGFVLMERRGETRGRADPDLYFEAHACDWGYVPNFFAPAPARDAASVELPVRPLETSLPNAWAVLLPADGSATKYRWLEIRTRTPLRAGHFELVDQLAATGSNRGVAFDTLGRGETMIRVRVGSCGQWRAYESRVLYLGSTVPQDVRSVRLVR